MLEFELDPPVLPLAVLEVELDPPVLPLALLEVALGLPVLPLAVLEVELDPPALPLAVLEVELDPPVLFLAVLEVALGPRIFSSDGQLDAHFVQVSLEASVLVQLEAGPSPGLFQDRGSSFSRSIPSSVNPK